MTQPTTRISEIIRNRIKQAQSDWDVAAAPFLKAIQASQEAIQTLKSGSDDAKSEMNVLVERLANAKTSLTELGDRPRFFAVDNISPYIKGEEEIHQLQEELQQALQVALQSMVIDVENDHNTKETAKRVAKMYLREVFHGRYDPKPHITEFPNDRHFDEIIVVGPLTVRSACSHHLVPIVGNLWIGIKPGDEIAGLSKYGRLAEWVLARPSIQEESVEILADELEKLIKPQGLIVSISASHLCMSWRGLKDKAMTTTSVVRGDFRKNPALKAEFFDQVKIMQQSSSIL